MDISEFLKTLRNRQGARPSQPRDWYSVRNLAAGEAEVFIYDVIGESWFGGVTAGQFVTELRAINATKILLRINSPGGDVADAVAIRNALIEHPAEIETHIDGIAASAAAWVGLAAEKVVIAPTATMMIHEPRDFAFGDAERMRKTANMLDMVGGQIAGMLQEKAGGTVDEWREFMRAETWYTHDEAVDAGLADEVAGAAPATQNRYDPTFLLIFKNTPEHLVAAANAKPRRRSAPPKPAASEPAAAAAPVAPSDELIRETLVYQRDRSRQLGVLV